MHSQTWPTISRIRIRGSHGSRDLTTDFKPKSPRCSVSCRPWNPWNGTREVKIFNDWWLEIAPLVVLFKRLEHQSANSYADRLRAAAGWMWGARLSKSPESSANRLSMRRPKPMWNWSRAQKYNIETLLCLENDQSSCFSRKNDPLWNLQMSCLALSSRI